MKTVFAILSILGALAGVVFFIAVFAMLVVGKQGEDKNENA